MQDNSNTYFAAKEGKDTADILLARAGRWYDNLEATGFKSKLRDMYFAYHGAYYDDPSGGHQISFAGEQGELATMAVNHLRNIAQHMLQMITANRPAMEARAANNDYRSLAQTYIANGILDYYLREKRLEKYLKKAVEYAVVFGSGYVKMDWNATTGEIFDHTDDGIPIYEGDIQFSNLSPFDVVHDATKEDDDHDWILIRTSKNKFDLAAKYPDLATKIIGLPTKSESDRFSIASMNVLTDTDDVFVYQFYHRKTDAMPAGRLLEFSSADTVYHDQALPYQSIPVFRISPSDILGTPFGYTPMFDLLPIQQGVNTMYSTILSNQAAFGVQSVILPRGGDWNATQLSGGLNILEGNTQAGMPTPLNLTSTPPEIFNFLKILEQAMETVSGVSSVTRGNADSLGSNPSGTAMALIQSMSIQFMSGLQQSYVALVEDVGTALIKMLQDYAATPRLIAIAGKNNRTELKQFTSDSIKGINRVIVDIGNALSRTTAGRVKMADQLLQYQMFTSPSQYINVINSGRLDVFTDGIQHGLMLIESENERLMEGENPLVTIFDKHSEHIIGHCKVLADPELRKDADLVGRVNAHIQQHLDDLRNTDPGLLGLIKEQALPPIQPPMPSPIEPPMEGMPQGAVSGQAAAGEAVVNTMQPPMAGQQGASMEGDHLVMPDGSSSKVPGPPNPPPPFDQLPIQPGVAG